MPIRTIEVEREGFVECWLTAGPAAGGAPRDGLVVTDAADVVGAMDRLYAELAGAIGDRLLPLQEKLYAPFFAREGVLAARSRRLREAGADPDVPCSFIEGRPGEPGFCGVQLWGVIPRAADVRVESVATPTGVRGRALRGPGFRVVALAAMGGLLASDAEDAHAGAHELALERMFADAQSALGALDLGFRDVARTWIYVADLLGDYPALNRVRTSFFGELGIDGRPGGRPFPASTGIQGAGGPGLACSMDLLAAEGISFTPLARTHRQGAAFAYGSAFSRAATLAYGGGRTLFVSGTASIDEQGRSRHEGDTEAQIVETLLAIAALLEAAGATLGDVASATVFVKRREVHDAFVRTCRLLGLPSFPYMPMLADVCRPELLFEIEALVPLRTPLASGVPR
jgi:enamine deaminase RidA (YjgF/YER057c/UK114 family)